MSDYILANADDGCCAANQYAAQAFVASSRNDTEPYLPRGRMIFWRQPDPGRELPTRSEHLGGGRFLLSIAAPIGPTPGISARRRLHGSVFCQAISW